MDSSAKCPFCKVNLQSDDVYEVNQKTYEVILQVCGYCPKCKRSYTWEEKFILDSIQNLEENS